MTVTFSSATFCKVTRNCRTGFFFIMYSYFFYALISCISGWTLSLCDKTAMNFKFINKFCRRTLTLVQITVPTGVFLIFNLDLWPVRCWWPSSGLFKKINNDNRKRFISALAHSLYLFFFKQSKEIGSKPGNNKCKGHL